MRTWLSGRKHLTVDQACQKRGGSNPSVRTNFSARGGMAYAAGSEPTISLMRHIVRVALVSLVLSASSVAAQMPQYTWMRHYKTAPDVRMLREPLDRLLAEKKITAYGVLAPFTHIGDPWTHIVYVSVADWASIEGVGQALDVMRASRPDDVHDVILRHAIQAQTPSTVKPKYVVLNRHPVSRGRDADAYALFNEWALPVFTELAAKNRVGNWAQLVQTVVLDNEWTYLVWYFLPDLGALDDITAALGKMGGSKLGTFERRLREMSEDDYRGQIMRVVYAVP